MDCFFSGGMREARLSELVASVSSSCAPTADERRSRSGIMSSSSVSVSVDEICGGSSYRVIHLVR